MKLLLDTHALLWYAVGDQRLSDEVRAALSRPGTDAYVSPVVLWELAIKAGLGKLELTVNFEAFVERCLRTFAMSYLPIEPSHIEHLFSLPNVMGHKDPFDQLLAAQALAEKLTLASVDKAFDAYGVSRIW